MHPVNQLYLLFVQLPSVIPYIDILCMNFPLCKTKCRPQRDSNPQSSDSKSDALSVGPFGIVSINCVLFVQLPSVIPCKDSIFKKFPLQEKVDQGIRTPNLLIRSQTPYPSLILTSFLRTFLCVKQNVDHRGIRTPNILIRSQTPYPSLILTSSLRNFLCVKQNVDHRGIRTPNLLIRSQTLYPLGHAVVCPVNCICCLFSCQVLSLILTSFVRNFLCVKQNVDHRGIRTPNLLIRSQTPYPSGHSAMHRVNQLYLLFVQLPSVIPYIDILCMNFPLCKTKCRPQRDSNPQSSDSKSDALSVGPFGHASCQSIVSVICSVAKCYPL